MLGETPKPVQAIFHSPSEFSAFLAGRPEACDPKAISRAADLIRQRGR